MDKFFVKTAISFMFVLLPFSLLFYLQIVNENFLIHKFVFNLIHDFPYSIKEILFTIVSFFIYLSLYNGLIFAINTYDYEEFNTIL